MANSSKHIANTAANRTAARSHTADPLLGRQGSEAPPVPYRDRRAPCPLHTVGSQHCVLSTELTAPSLSPAQKQQHPTIPVEPGLSHNWSSLPP